MHERARVSMRGKDLDAFLSPPPHTPSLIIHPTSFPLWLILFQCLFFASQEREIGDLTPIDRFLYDDLSLRGKLRKGMQLHFYQHQVGYGLFVSGSVLQAAETAECDVCGRGAAVLWISLSVQAAAPPFLASHSSRPFSLVTDMADEEEVQPEL
jgi:hypothetical protein